MAGLARRLLRPLRLVAKALVAEHAPRQLAWGFALGMVIGLVPKGNLIAVGLVLVLFATRVNVGAGLVSAAVFSWVGAYLDPAADQLGYWLLTAPSLHRLWSSLYQIPLVPWSGFNNTVVLGSLALGLALLYPVYEISRCGFGWPKPRAASWIRKYRVTRVLFGVEVAAGWRVG